MLGLPKTKQKTSLWCCNRWNSKIQLYIQHRPVADFPMTMTPQECLEDWCESMGWRLLHCYGSEGLVYQDYYEFRFSHPRYDKVCTMIPAASNTYSVSTGVWGAL